MAKQNAKVVRFELDGDRWIKKIVKGNLSIRAAQEESSQLNGQRDDVEQTMMICYVVEN
jgi:predicted proteasome-type protease